MHYSGHCGVQTNTFKANAPSVHNGSGFTNLQCGQLNVSPGARQSHLQQDWNPKQQQLQPSLPEEEN